MNILLFGPQGSGKGTQARLLIDKYNLSYFESGSYLRRIAAEHSEIKKILDEGGLVPDKEFTSYLTAYLDQNGLYDGIIFDGFPRTVDQYHFLKNWLKDKDVRLDLVFVIEISESESVRRLGARRQDSETGKIYNLITDPPPDNVNKSRLIRRTDDYPEAIKKRLSIYRSTTQKLIDELRRETKVILINGERSIDEIHKDIVSEIENFRLNSE